MLEKKESYKKKSNYNWRKKITETNSNVGIELKLEELILIQLELSGLMPDNV